MYLVICYESYLDTAEMILVFAEFAYVCFHAENGGWEIANSALRELMDVITPLSLYDHFA